MIGLSEQNLLHGGPVWHNKTQRVHLTINVETNFAQLLGPNSTEASGKRNIVNPFEHFYTIDIYLRSICTVDILEESCFECFHTNDILNVLTPLISWKHLVLVLMLIFSHFGNAHPL